MAQLNAMGNNAQGAGATGRCSDREPTGAMQKLRQLVMSQMNMQANYMAAEAAKDAANSKGVLSGSGTRTEVRKLAMNDMEGRSLDG